MPHHNSPLQKALTTLTFVTLFPFLTIILTLFPTPTATAPTPTPTTTTIITPSLINLPTSPNQQKIQIPACTFPNPTKPLWTITNWTATNSTTNSTENNNHPGSGDGNNNTEVTNPEDYTLLFHLTNTLTGYTALCTRVGIYPEGTCVLNSSSSASSASTITSTPGPATPDPERSAGGAGGGDGEGEDTTGTIFSYNERVGSLEVYQEWVCLFGEREGEVG